MQQQRLLLLCARGLRQTKSAPASMGVSSRVWAKTAEVYQRGGGRRGERSEEGCGQIV